MDRKTALSLSNRAAVIAAVLYYYPREAGVS
jgi:hypothetical protein